MKPHEKALKLRKKGYSYSHISTETGLSKSTLSYHLRDVLFTPNKKTALKIGSARARASETKARQKRNSILEAKKLAHRDIGHLTKRDILMLGLGVYIGEGSKTQDLIRVVNSDYRVINVFIRWLIMFGFTKRNFAIRIHAYPDTNIRETTLFWTDKTGLTQEQFQKPCIDRRVNKDRKRSGKHQYGTAHVTVRSNGDKAFGVAFSRRISAWMEEVLE